MPTRFDAESCDRDFGAVCPDKWVAIGAILGDGRNQCAASFQYEGPCGENVYAFDGVSKLGRLRWSSMCRVGFHSHVGTYRRLCVRISFHACVEASWPCKRARLETCAVQFCYVAHAFVAQDVTGTIALRVRKGGARWGRCVCSSVFLRVGSSHLQRRSTCAAGAGAEVHATR